MSNFFKTITLERLANIAVLAVALAALTLLGLNYFASKARSDVRAGLERGSSFSPIPGINYGDHQRTLLIALNTQCEYCRESQPFYRRLTEAARRSDNPVHIVALFPNQATEAKDFMIQNQLEFDVVSNVRFADLRIGGTPSIVLLDQDGTIRDFWIGKVASDQEQHAIDAILRQ